MPEFHLYCQIHLSVIILNFIDYDGSIVDTSCHIILFPSILVMTTYFKLLCQNMGSPFTAKGHEPLPFQELNFETQTKQVGFHSAALNPNFFFFYLFSQKLTIFPLFFLLLPV